VPGSALSATAGLPASGCGQSKLNLIDRRQIAPLPVLTQRSKYLNTPWRRSTPSWSSVSPSDFAPFPAQNRRNQGYAASRDLRAGEMQWPE
jgi:hypothetical protein